MPPRIRTRATKAQKENINTENRAKSIKTNTKAPRKPLTDKTNSASDSSVEVSKAVKKVPNKSSKDEIKLNSEIKNDERPRRNRRLPTRYVENPISSNLSHNSMNSAIVLENSTVNGAKPKNVSKEYTPVKNQKPEVSPFKTPGKADSSLVMSRPRRICRLPSRFDDHSVSPSKYILIQPDNASTPIQQSKSKPSQTNKVDQDNTAKKSPQIAQRLNNKEKVDKENKAKKPPQTLQQSSKPVQKKIDKNLSSNKSTPDSNNNAKGRSTRAKKAVPKPSPKKNSPKINSIKRYLNKAASPILSPLKKISPEATKGKRIIDKSMSFRVLGGTKRSQESDKNDLDIYEFTFDPAEEPKPLKKKRKKPVIKKSTKVTKPKAAVTYKSTYDKNISKALSVLKNAVKSKAAAPAKLPQIQETLHEVAETDEQNHVESNNISAACKANQMSAMNNTGKESVHECNYPSIRVEDIAADIEPSIDHHDDLNYSPVNSPRPASPNLVLDPRESPERAPNNDPLNLQEELSFFDDVPVASSSMNVSVRHPMASPWRVEFGSLPIKWHSNTYVKPNMTPAVECSFICSEDSNKKKHVYTNMVPETNDSLPQIVNETPNLKQTSIISFIREVAERQAEKKRGRSVSPTKALAVLNNTDVERNTTPKKIPNDKTNNDPSPIVNTSKELSSNTDVSDDKENSKDKRKTTKRKNDENVCDRPAKSPRKQKDKDCTYFGFDDSEIQDENVSPTKSKTNVRGRSLRPRSRAVLQEINGPTRAVLPVAAKSKLAPSSEVINKVYEELKSAADAPVFPEKNVQQNVTNIEETLDDDAESVHLFEDIEVVHHLKPTRKSYGKAKKVTFQQHSTSNSGSQEAIACHNDISFEDDLGDLTFEVPNVKEKKKSKKKKPKKLMSKKEEKQAEEWAAGFNSMCEEIEEFPLVVE